MPRYKCTVEYDGTGFFGWQRQDSVPSVQQALEEAIHAFSGEQVTIHTAGRTDAGVHALGQVMHFDLVQPMDPLRIQGACNFHIRPHGVVVLACDEVDAEFHARYSATRRHYMYRIINRRPPLVLELDRAWHVPLPLDVVAMQEATKILIGHHDFTSFRDSECQARSPVKTLDTLNIIQNGVDIRIYCSAPSFLHHMVRNIVGTLELVGSGKWTADDVQAALDAKDRRAAGPTAPAAGLYLTKVEY